jgi:NADH-quinone oxidoreductase subunit D
VLRVIVELDGEYIRKSEPVLGYVHRMHEKMGEVKTYPQYLPNMGRVDYLHALAWNWAYVGAVEKLMGITVPPRAEYIRVITCELNRISSHLLWWGPTCCWTWGLTPSSMPFADRSDHGHPADGTGAADYCYYPLRGVSATDEFPAHPHFVNDFQETTAHVPGPVTDDMILRGRCEEIGASRRWPGATAPPAPVLGARGGLRRALSRALFGLRSAGLRNPHRQQETPWTV